MFFSEKKGAKMIGGLLNKIRTPQKKTADLNESFEVCRDHLIFYF